ncbi:MAG: glycoside hydrolase family 5 protein, partial [Candidatus Izemoplasmatales bacterium]
MQKRMMISACVFLLGFLIFGCNSATTATPTTATPTTAVATSTQMPTTDQPTTATAITTQSLEELMSEQGLQTMSSLEVVFYMGNGTNLGNTMEAFGRTTIGTDQDVSAYETLWGQPITTAAMISGMKAAGFDTLRIPVAWTNTMDIDNDDYTIRQDYLERVAEIVNYALDAEMFVIINDHWDGGWWGMFGASSQSIRNKAWAIYDSIWTQVGNYFKDYSYRLIFESANEELGNRLNDAINEINGVLTENECYEQANAINQEFVDIIRSQGGKNADRFLLIAGYNTDIEMTYDNRFNMPTDSATDKLLLSVHYYTPWTYCGSSGDASWGTENHYNTQNTLLEKMTKYTDMGYGIVFGEFAVLTKSDGSLKNNTVDFIRNFLDNCDKYGYVPVLWDTNAFFIREELEIFDEELASLYHERSFTQQFSLSYAEVISQAETSMAHYLQLAIQ